MTYGDYEIIFTKEGKKIGARVTNKSTGLKEEFHAMSPENLTNALLACLSLSNKEAEGNLREDIKGYYS